jgi:hypothetical protein
MCAGEEPLEPERETMKKYLVAAAAAGFLMMGGMPAHAAETPADPIADCGLNSRQVNAGWTCTKETDIENVSRTIGGGSRCQDATITTTITRAYNPAGNEAEEKTDVSEPTESDWGSSYPIGDGCKY